MDTKKVEVLLRAIELGSLSKAAQEYSYTPSAVSHILDSIETELGACIIKRTFKGIEVIPEYEDVVQNLKDIINLKNKTTRLVTEKKNGRKTVTVATYASLSKYVLPKIIKGFNLLHPDVNVNIIVADRMKEVCNDNMSDLMIGEETTNCDVCWENLMTDPYVAVFPETYALNSKTIKREDLYGQTFIMVSDRKVLEYINVEKFNNVINVNSHDDSSVLHMVKEGMGMAILPLLSVKDFKNIVYSLLEPELSRTICIAYRKEDISRKKELKSFVEYIRKFDLSGI